MFKRSRENSEVAAVTSRERWWLGPERGQQNGKEEAGEELSQLKDKQALLGGQQVWLKREVQECSSHGFLSFFKVVFCQIQILHSTRAVHQMLLNELNK